MDVAEYILFAIGGVLLAFAGVFVAFAGVDGFKNKSVTIVSFAIGTAMIVVACYLHWQASRRISSARLRAKLEDQVEQTFQKKRTALLAAKAPPSEIDDLYRWRDYILKQLNGVVEFIESSLKEGRSTIPRKALTILQERGVDATVEFLTLTLNEEEKSYRERGRELAEASLLKGSLQQLSADYAGAKESIEKAIRFDPSWWLPHNLMGLQERNLGHWDAAQELFDEAEKLTHIEQDLSAIYTNRAALLQTTGRFQEAEALMRKSLTIKERGLEDRDLAMCLLNLTGLLIETNRPGEAEPLARRALAILEVKSDTDSLDLALCLNNLGMVLRTTDRLPEAEAAFRRALRITEKDFGPEHPNVAACLNNLAELLDSTNRMTDGEPLMRRALEIDRKAYGEEHPNVANRLNNLAYILKETNRFAEAEKMYWTALTIDQKSFGWDHPRIANRLNNIAQLFQKTNRLYETEPLMWEALRIDEETLGPEHPNVAIRLNNLVVLFEETNRLSQCEPMMKRSLLVLLKSTFTNGYPNALLKRGVLGYRRTLRKMRIRASEIDMRLESIAREAGFDATGAREILQSLH
jgi:tetratricopeptide (TPR) repeat protein